jgi:acyl-CoA-binding protein
LKRKRRERRREKERKREGRKSKIEKEKRFHKKKLPKKMPSFSSSPLPPAAASAVAALEAAGTDLDALAAAIKAASFLDETPGSARQALRGKRRRRRGREKEREEEEKKEERRNAPSLLPLTKTLFPSFFSSHLPTNHSTAARTRLRKALADAAAKAQAAAASAAADVSPFAKSSYDVSADFPALSSTFESLAWRAIAKPGGATVKPDPYYELFALNAQAQRGDVTGERPMWAERGGLDFDGRARWDAHSALRGASSEEAKKRFVELYWEFSPRALYSEGRGKK